MNPYDSGRFCTESLESAAKRYKTLGFSIIPLQGARNPQQPKQPAIKWARFQHSFATEDELHTWFGEQADVGIGIVCGRVSRLMVLDFDSASAASEFRRVCPDMVKTFTVLSGTRHLPHLYFRLAEGKLIPTSAYAGVDLRGEGSYVVAPPTQIGSAAWTVSSNLPLRDLSEFDLRRIMRFLSSCKGSRVEPVVELAEPQSKSVVSEFRQSFSSEELIAYYHKRTYKGRNHALFQTAVVGRDMGMSQTAFSLLFAPIHASEPGGNYEPVHARHVEALRTISSAFSRPARRNSDASIGLSIAVREWLLMHDLVNVARVLDGLFAVGVAAGEMLSERQMCQKLAALKIGRRSVMSVLSTNIEDWRLFEVVDPPHIPPQHANAAKRSDDLKNSCEMSRGAKRVKNGRGRPARIYRVPSGTAIAEKIGVHAKLDGAPGQEAFSSPRAYRQALHTELFARRPGHYGRAWLSERLGVSRWTARRYEKEAGIEVQPAYVAQGLSWSSATTLPEKASDAPAGMFIEVEGGKRYPPIRGLALRLIKTGRGPVLKHQRGNYYCVRKESIGIPTPYSVQHTSSILNVPYSLARERSATGSSVGIPTPLEYMPPKNHMLSEVNRTGTRTLANHSDAQEEKRVGIPTPPQDEPEFWLCPQCLNFHIQSARPSDCSRCGTLAQWEIVPSRIWRDAQALKSWWSKRYQEHKQSKRESQSASTKHHLSEKPMLDETKALTERLHQQIPDLSFRNARRLVEQFSKPLIEKAIDVVVGRGKLRNPAGFLVSYLRSESKAFFSNNNLGSPKSMKGESTVDWLRRLAKSEYLSFISNVDDLLNMQIDQPIMSNES